MRRTLTLIVLALTLSGGVALANPRGGGNHRGNGGVFVRGNRGGGVVRDHRGNGGFVDNGYRGGNGGGVRYRGGNYQNQRLVVRRPVFQRDGWFDFGGFRHGYRYPVIRGSFTNHHYRPALLVENYQAVPGYIWTPGEWRWDGYQWTWIPGHYDVDSGYASGSTYVDSGYGFGH